MSNLKPKTLINNHLRLILNKGSKSLLCAVPGVENETLMFEIINYCTESLGKRVVILINNKPVSALKQEALRLGLDLSASGITFIDSYSRAVNLSSDEEFIVSNPRDFKSIKSAVNKALAGSNDSLLFINDLSLMIDSCGESVIKEFNDWFNELNELNLVSLFTEWPYDKSLIESLSSNFNLVIKLNSLKRRGFLSKYLRVIKNDVGASSISMPLSVFNQGRLNAYSPKLLIAGGFNSGKDEFLKSASKRAVSIDDIGTGLSIKHVQADYSGVNIDLFSAQGSNKLSPVIDLLGEGAMGVLFFVDSSDKDSMLVAGELINNSRNLGLPSVIIANKPDSMGDSLKLMNAPVIFKDSTSSAFNIDEVNKVFDLLFKQLI